MCNKIISKGILAAVAVSVLLSGMVLGCKQASGGGDTPIVETPTVETINYVKSSDNYYEYKTNDSANYWSGWMWTFDTAAPASATVSVECIKYSGATDWGYGMTFFRQDKDNFYDVICTTNGYYCVNKKISGNWLDGINAPVKWAESSNLVQGYGKTNKFTVKPTATTNQYELLINDQHEVYFTNTDFTSGGKFGFYTSIGKEADEKFPGTPVDTKFKLISPTI